MKPLSLTLIVSTACLTAMTTGCATNQATTADAAEHSATGVVAAAPAAPEPRPAEAIAADIEAVAFPSFDAARREDREYVEAYIALQAEATETQSELVAELLDGHPDHELLPRLLPRRWMQMSWDPAKQDQARAEASAVLARDSSGPLAAEAWFALASISMREAMTERDPDGALAVAEEFIAAVPGDERGGRLLSDAARAFPEGSDQRIAAYQRVCDLYPDTRTAGFAAGQIRQSQSLGKPFELAFTCAVSGTEIDMKALRGKVVLIDFWATWCGPCVAEMPHLKELYARHRDEGFEIIGVSLDQPEEQGGLQKLREFVEKEDIRWPQYYQGKGWDSEFSGSWGINGIPALFMVDKAGNLRTVSARGKLDELIPQLLAESKDELAAGG